MSKLRSALLCGALGLVAAMAATASQAATGSWNGSVAAPVIRQTNTDYTSGNIPPGTQPSGTLVTSTNWFSS